MEQNKAHEAQKIELEQQRLALEAERERELELNREAQRKLAEFEEKNRQLEARLKQIEEVKLAKQKAEAAALAIAQAALLVPEPEPVVEEEDVEMEEKVTEEELARQKALQDEIELKKFQADLSQVEKGLVVTKLQSRGSAAQKTVRVTKDTKSSDYFISWDSKWKKASDARINLNKSELYIGTDFGLFTMSKYSNTFQSTKCLTISGPKKNLSIVFPESSSLALWHGVLTKLGNSN